MVGLLRAALRRFPLPAPLEHSVDTATMPTAITPRLVLISGVSGFLGTATTLEFLKKGWKGAPQTLPFRP